MGVLFLQKKECSRQALAHALQDHLETLGIDYHTRTLRRQLTGSVSSVPPEVQEAMRHVLLQANGLRTDTGIEKALRRAGLGVAAEERQAAYLSTERLVPLVQLWLLENPTRSGRALAMLLAKQLAHRGIQLGINPLQNSLTGRQPLARREVYEAVLALLAPLGITSDDEARSRWEQRQKDIRDYTQDRTLEPSERLDGLVRAWKLREHEPSSRHLAVILHQKLRERGIKLGLHQLHEALDGKVKRVRRALLLEMEQLLRQNLPEGHNLHDAVAAAAVKQARQIDLCWVNAKPIAALARTWVEKYPDVSMRQLSIRVAKSVRRRGYATSHNTIQAILGGHKKKTRGFVYRAMLRQIPGARDRIPVEHMRIPVQADQRFWLKPISDSGSCRSAILVEADQP